MKYIHSIVCSARRRSRIMNTAAKRKAAPPNVATKGVIINAFRNEINGVSLSSAPCWK